mmetsp:Transcript_17669/g.49280  ORF Transcript_17669/g.49280 Transcript_17669/m.49280 type:complete len:292 (+) Transcript_17669:304-1179(+)
MHLGRATSPLHLTTPTTCLRTLALLDLPAVLPCLLLLRQPSPNARELVLIIAAATLLSNTLYPTLLFLPCLLPSRSLHLGRWPLLYPLVLILTVGLLFAAFLVASASFTLWLHSLLLLPVCCPMSFGRSCCPLLGLLGLALLIRALLLLLLLPLLPLALLLGLLLIQVFFLVLLLLLFVLLLRRPLLPTETLILPHPWGLHCCCCCCCPFFLFLLLLPLLLVLSDGLCIRLLQPLTLLPSCASGCLHSTTTLLLHLLLLLLLMPPLLLQLLLLLPLLLFDAAILGHDPRLL